jgi:hypothetical protein
MSSAQFSRALSRVLRQPAFLAAFVVLLVAAVGLNASVQFLKLHFKKQPVPLARPLTLVPDRFGPWVQVTPDKAIDHEIQDVLGTDQYIFREYIDERIAGSDVKDRFKALASDELRQDLLSKLRAQHRDSVVNLAVTYYTGMVDTVAHVPDRCYIADGYEPRPEENDKPFWTIGRDLPAHAKPLDGNKLPSDDIQVRYINFEDQTGTNKLVRSVAYFFHTNGSWAASPIDVRLKLQNIRERYGYYAKVEVMTLEGDSKKSAAVMTDFLSAALPEIYRCMPDWSKVTGSGTGANPPVETASAKQ